jgi:lipoprotein-anchoring transpeptidase ErfK/SrfK
MVGGGSDEEAAMSKRIRVVLSRQVLIAYDGKRQVYEFDCATGDSSHPTGPGNFRIFRKHRTHVSSKYNVPMDFAMFFTMDGKAIHKSHFVGPISFMKFFGADSLGSHGCVRLSDKDAQALFDWTPIGTPVDIG